jgi:hypothetical protein
MVALQSRNKKFSPEKLAMLLYKIILHLSFTILILLLMSTANADFQFGLNASNRDNSTILNNRLFLAEQNHPHAQNFLDGLYNHKQMVIWK